MKIHNAYATIINTFIRGKCVFGMSTTLKEIQWLSCSSARVPSCGCLGILRREGRGCYMLWTVLKPLWVKERLCVCKWLMAEVGGLPVPVPSCVTTKVFGYIHTLWILNSSFTLDTETRSLYCFSKSPRRTISIILLTNTQTLGWKLRWKKSFLNTDFSRKWSPCTVLSYSPQKTYIPWSIKCITRALVNGIWLLFYVESS